MNDVAELVKSATNAVRMRNASIVPKNLEETERLAEIFFKAGIVPKGVTKPATVIALIIKGLEVGIMPAEAVTSLMVVNGKMTLWGDSLLALVRRSGLLEKITETYTEKPYSATCVVVRTGGEKISRTFSEADLIRSKLLDKPGPWHTFPQRMYPMRARSFALRDLFGDVLCGLVASEEYDRCEGYEDAVYEVQSPAPSLAIAAPVVSPSVEAPVAHSSGQSSPEGSPKAVDIYQIDIISRNRVEFLNRIGLAPSEWKTYLAGRYSVDSARSLTYQQADQLIGEMLPPGPDAADFAGGAKSASD